MNPGDAVLVWSGPVACGARVLNWDPPTAAVHGQVGHVWIDVCILGQHLPQSYKIGELVPLDADMAPRFGLCAECVGFGTTDTGPVGLAAGIDQIKDPCPGCGGSGRPAVRVTVTRTRDSVHGHMEVLAHEPMMLKDSPMCLACGLAPDEPFAMHQTASKLA